MATLVRQLRRRSPLLLVALCRPIVRRPCYTYSVRADASVYAYGGGPLTLQWSTPSAVRCISTSPTRSIFDPLIQYGLKKFDETKKVSIKFLPSKPVHAYQPRKREVVELANKFQGLRERHGKVVLTMYVKGTPACGKTQLAREFGETYYKECMTDTSTTHSTTLPAPRDKWRNLATPAMSYIRNTIAGKGVVVATIDMRTTSSLWRTYTQLALGLDCSMDGMIASFEYKDRLSVVSNEVQKKLKWYPNWLLIIDGMTVYKANTYRAYWPHPGSEDWGCGHVVVTTNEERVIQHHNECADFLTLGRMSEEDAVALLHNVSGYDGEGGKEVVNSKYVEGMPLEVSSAGIYIKKARVDDPTFTFKKYSEEVHNEAREMLAEGRNDYPDTTITATAKAAKQLASSEPFLNKVFTVLACCPHDPIPMNVICRLLGTELNCDTREIQAIRKCDLLILNSQQVKAQSSFDAVERVTCHRSTRDGFKVAIDTGADAQERQALIQTFINCLLQEYEEANKSRSSSSFWTKHLLIPHLAGFLQDPKMQSQATLGQSQKVQLAAALSNVYIDLYRNPQRAKKVFDTLQTEVDILRLTPADRAKFNLGLGKICRHLGQYEESNKHLTEALNDKTYLQPMEVADILKELSATVSNYGEYMHSIEFLEGALALYQDKLGSHHPTVVEAESCLANQCARMGEWEEAKKHLKGAEEVLQKLHKSKPDGSESTYPLTLTAREDLAMAYAELGDHKKSISLLQEVVEETKHIHGSPHMALVVPLSRLSTVYYYKGDRKKSKEVANEALNQVADPPWTALQMLATVVYDFGDVPWALNLNLLSKIEQCRQTGRAPTDGTQLLKGRIYKQLGDLNQALEFLEAFLRKSETTYGKNHIRVGKILIDLGKVYQELGFLTKAFDTFDRSHRIHEEFYSGRRHPEVAFILADLARISQHIGNSEQGTNMMKEALTTCKQNIDNPAIQGITTMHVKYAQILSNYGLIQRDSGNLQEALQVLNEALQLQDSILTDKSLMRIKTIYTLGTVHDRLEEHSQAKVRMDTAYALVKSMENNFPTKPSHHHPYQATIATGLARFHQKMCDFKQAQFYAQEALDIRVECCGETHPQVAFCYKILGEISAEGGHTDKAHEYFLNAYTVYVSLRVRAMMHKSNWLLNPDLEGTTKWTKLCKELEEKLQDTVA